MLQRCCKRVTNKVSSELTPTTRRQEMILKKTFYLHFVEERNRTRLVGYYENKDRANRILEFHKAIFPERHEGYIVENCFTEDNFDCGDFSNIREKLTRWINNDWVSVSQDSGKE